jgi:2-C-methyl-D-erythritol 4-phosphate cytidylyltransferase
MATVWSIVVAGGTGSRFGAPKQYALIGGRPVLEWAVDACRPGSAGVVLVLPLDAADLADSDSYGADTTVRGGATRADSVRCGLAAVPAAADVIVVHDAARPLASRALFDAVVAALDGGDVDGAVPGMRPSDTIKAVDATGRVTSTLDRAGLVAVQTPQAFRAAALRLGHELAAAGAAATDDAMLVEAVGGRVLVVPGEPGNLKITAPDDLDTAERLLAERRG